jgi:hypothetical protein
MTNWSSMAKASGREWYLAASLIALGNEVNARWPNRDTASDGALGDASHQARVSDHNPDYSAGGVVRAIDIDSDGIDVQQVLDAIIGDPRAWYVIWDRHIYSRTYGWAKRPYDGTDPHTGHLHVSINHTTSAETNTSRWLAQQEDDQMTPEQMAELKAYIHSEVYAGPRYAALQNSINAVGKAVAVVMPYLKAEDAADDAALTKAVADLKAAIAAHDVVPQ